VSRTQMAEFVGAGLGPKLPGQRCLLVCRVAWDGGIGYVASVLAHGGLVALPDEEQIRNPEAVAALGARGAVTMVIAPPSFYRLLLEQAKSFGADVRDVIVAGEAFPGSLVERHQSVLPAAVLWNMYGPTEVTVACTAFSAGDRPRDVVPIGRTAVTTTAYVLDDRLRPVPRDTVGELYLGGSQVVDGYAGLPGRTAERFVPDPFRTDPSGARMYRTGDLAVVDDDGELVFRGRVDRQVKIRGARVELGEVEAVLNAHRDVGKAVVLCESREETAEDALVAFYAPEPGGTISDLPPASTLRAYCRSALVDQAVPEDFVALESIPLDPNGKSDFTALREHRRTAASGGGRAGDPRLSPIQRQVARCWAAVLDHADSALDDDFFAMGGNSRRVVALHLRFERDWPGVLRVGELFDLVSIEAQAAAIASRTGEAMASAAASATSAAPVAFEV
jgi:acyl-CoA synthetase (AMP-forming)/AMP-acid ligase II